MVPACGGRTEAAKLIPVRRMWATSEIDTRELRVGWKNESLRGDFAERCNARRLREFGHECQARVRSRASVTTASTGRPDSSHSRGLSGAGSLSSCRSESGNTNREFDDGI